MGGILKAMPPMLNSDDGRNTVIRPLAYCREVDISGFAVLMQYPIIPVIFVAHSPNLNVKRLRN